MVEVKLCVVKLDGTSEYRRVTIPVLTPNTDILSVLREKLVHFFPEINSPSNEIHFDFQYEGKTTEKRSFCYRLMTR